MTKNNTLPVAVIGAGPIGLAAAVHLTARGIEPLVLEAGTRVAASMWDWKHVQLFTPWAYLVDPASQRLLEKAGTWSSPDEEDIPFARELVERYLDPLAALEELAPHVNLQHKVVGVGRVGHDRMKDGNRDDTAFLIVAETPDGPRRFHARAIIDASGTWTTPNPLGAGGMPADGEEEHQSRIRYGIPDVLGGERERYAGKRILVVGSGHSAIGTALSLLELATEDPETLVAWAIRRSDPSSLWGEGSADQLRARGALKTKIHDAVYSGRVALLTGLSIAALRASREGIEVVGVDGVAQVVVDEVVVATGSRPDLGMLRELRLKVDPATEASGILGPMIDPNRHSCGTVRPHGAVELAHHEKDLYVVGMKSYGRAPTFLLRTGYEQARSVVAELAGDHEAARRVELVLPETGVCSTERGSSVEPCC